MDQNTAANLDTREGITGELPRDAEALIRLCKEQGWTVDYTTAGHVRLTPPDVSMQRVTWPKKVGDSHSLMNFRSQLKRSGLRPPMIYRRPLPSPPVVTKLATLADIAALHDNDRNTKPDATTNTTESDDMRTNGAHVNGTDSKVIALTADPTSPRKVGAQRDAILEAVARADHGAGVLAADILLRMQVFDPTITMKRLGVAMSNLCASERLVRRSRARYSVATSAMTPRLIALAIAPDAAATPPEPDAKPAPTAAPSLASLRDVPPASEQTTLADDLAAVDLAINALHGVKRIMLQYQEIAHANAAMMTLLAKFKP